MKKLATLALATAVGLLGPSPGRAQDLLISEFMASNESTIPDEYGLFSDWIEICNAGGSDANTDGWYLTDDRDELAMWRIPEVILGPGEYLLIFATGEDRSDPASELHTNFRLRAEGDYLALVKPDGVNVAMQFTPTYPFQFADLSFGLKQSRRTTALILEGATSSAWIPTSGALGTTWTEAGFSDGGWTQGSSGVGFDTGTDYGALIGTDLESAMLDVNATAYIRVPFTAADPAAFDELILRMRYDDGFIAYINGQEVARRNAAPFASWNSTATAEHGQPQMGRMSQDFSGGGTPYVLTVHGSNFPPRVLSGGPAGNYLELLRDDTASLSNTVGFDRVFGPAERIEARFDFRMPVEAGHTGCCGERADGFGFALLDTQVYGESGPGPTADNIVWERPVFPNTFSVGFDIFNGQGTENTVTLNWNSVEVTARLVSAFQLNNGVFNRCEIVITRDGNSSLVSLTLTPNSLGNPGAPVVVLDNFRVPGMTPFDSRVAFGGRTGGAFISLDLDNIEVDYTTSVSQEIVAEEIDISEHVGALRSGANVLAIHGLNLSAGDPDFLILPELEAHDNGSIQTGIYYYFDEPTPGGANVGGIPGFAEPAEFSREAGGFPAAFDLGLEVLSPSAVVRYTLNRSEPTESSPRYTAPIRISSTTIVKAKTFQPGLLPSPTITKTYVQLASDVRSFNSNLPIVLVETFGQGINDQFQTPCQAVFIPTGESGRATITDVPDFHGSGGIKLRGSSSLGFPKKMFAFETWDKLGNDRSVSILGFPDEADYVLYAPYSDKALMRNVLSYAWGNRIGRYSARTQFVEVFVNTNAGNVSNSDYVGVYVFMEKIKRDDSRVDIRRLLPSQNREPEISGGYIIKKDRLDPGDSGFLTSRGQRLAYVEPKEREITPAQASWLLNYMNTFEAALYGPNFTDPVNGYARYIDVGSFIDQHILVEFTKNIDGYRLSAFYHKDRGGKLVMGPMWDWNLSLGNANYLEGWLANGWYYPLISSEQYPYFPRLFQDREFRQKYIDRWTELRKDKLSTSRLLADIDATTAYLAESQVRNFQRWRILGTYVWPNWFIANTYLEEINWMKGWLADRLAWFDSNYLTPPSFNQDGGLMEPGFELVMSAPVGTVYYTLDGSDPRLDGGGISPGATAFGTASSMTLVADGVSPEVRVLVPGDGALGTSWTAAAFDDRTWLRGTNGIGVGYERGAGYEQYIDVDVGPDMDGIHPSVYIRVPFTVQDPAAVQSLSLRMRYDDGFVAYLNGTRIARANDPSPLQWDSSATGLHDDTAAVVFESWDVSSNISALRTGSNVLAIHGLNESLGSSDMLIEPALYASTTFVEGEPVVLTEPTHVIARSWNDGEWSGRSAATFVLDTDLPLRITEIMYHPRAQPSGSPYSGGGLEFIEILNVGAVPVNLSGVRFVDGIEFDFTSSAVESLGPDEYVLIVRNLSAFEWYYDTAGMNIAGEYNGHLDNGGEIVQLIDGTGQLIHDFRYNDDWYLETDGGGYSLVIADPLADPSTWELASSWLSGGEIGGTPGYGESDLPARRGFQRPGDSNQDSVLDLSDAIAILLHLFSGAAVSLPCDGDSVNEGGNLIVFDLNGDATVNLSDAVHLLDYLFLNGPPATRGTGCVRVDGCSTVCLN